MISRVTNSHMGPMYIETPYINQIDLFEIIFRMILIHWLLKH